MTKKDVYPLPRIDDTIDLLGSSNYFSSLDLFSDYYQIKMDPQDKEKTAFITTHGLFEYEVLPFGLVNAPSEFQRLMDLVLSGLKWSICLVYLDDIVVYSKTFDEHIERLELVFNSLKAANFKCRSDKCEFCMSSIRYLRFIVGKDGI